MPEILVQMGQPIPYSKKYRVACNHFNFYELSNDGGETYIDGKDSRGQPIFWPHENESDNNVKRRKALAVYNNYCEPVVRKYNSFVFGMPILRDEQNDGFKEWMRDVTLLGTSLHEYMRKSLYQAQVFGYWYAVADTTKTDPQQTVAQSVEAGNRLFFTSVDPRAVCHAIIREDTLIEVLFKVNDTTFHHYDSINFTEIRTDPRTHLVISILTNEHGFGQIPVVMFMAMDFCRSQLREIAPMNKVLTNLYSLLIEESFKNTFSQQFLFGVDADAVQEVKNVMDRKIVCINRPDAKLDRATADSSQAESLRATIELFEEQIFRLAGLHVPDVIQNEMSGRALLIKFEDVATQARAIADHAEEAENRMIDLYNIAYGADIQPSEYPEEFVTSELASELEITLKIVQSELPDIIKAQQIRALTSMYYPKMSPELRQRLESELRVLEGEPPPTNEPPPEPPPQ